MEFETFHFPNGLRVVFQPVDSPISHACILINAGSRDEDEGRFGLAHFIEHLLFKKTEKRTTTQILNRLESVGADLNAYTTKEYTCLHASFLTPYLERTLDLFEDLLFHSVFPDEELEKERGVILDEIASYQDSPEDAIIDDFEDLMFGSHGLGHNILGTESTVRSLDKQDVFHFLGAHYHPPQIVIGISGRYSSKTIRGKAERIFGKIDEGPAALFRNATPPDTVTSAYIEHHRPLSQVHQMIGSRAYGIHHDKRTGLLLLNNLLGGMGMSSKLNMVVREKHGIAYTVESNYTPFLDTGLFTVYFGTDTDKYLRARKLILREFKKLRENKLGPGQMHQAKKKFKGQIALGEENRLSLLIGQVKSVLDHGYTQTLADIFDKIDDVSAEDLLEIANEILSEDQLFTLSFLPE